MSRPDAIVHIGFNKCGSTAIQKWLGEAAPELERHGICYRRTDPRPDAICTNPHMSVLAYTLADRTIPFRPINPVLGFAEGDRVRQDAVAHDYRATVEALAASDWCRQFVASSEFLVTPTLTVDVIAALAGWLSATFGTVRYIAYIRNPEAWFVSLYGHEFRAGRTSETIEGFVERVRVVPYGPLLRKWGSVVGEAALDVRLFDEEWLAGPGLLDDFARQLDMRDPLNIPASTGINTSWKSEERGTWRTFFSRNPEPEALPPRPQLAPSSRQALHDRSAEDLDWIEETFFRDQSAEFRAWKTPGRM